MTRHSTDVSCSLVISLSGVAGVILGNTNERIHICGRWAPRASCKVGRSGFGINPIGEWPANSQPSAQLSITGGLLYLDDPLDEGIKAEVMFHVGNCTVCSKAAMLLPVWATQGCLQPFEFTDLAEDDRRTLESDLGTFLGQSSSAATIEEKSLGAAAGRDN